MVAGAVVPGQIGHILSLVLLWLLVINCVATPILCYRQSAISQALAWFDVFLDLAYAELHLLTTPGLATLCYSPPLPPPTGTVC